jgi:hypothetical protein
VEGSENQNWQGSAWDVGDRLDPYGIREVVIEFDNGDSDTFRPRLQDEFYSYELQQMVTYIDTIAGAVHKDQRR